MYKDNKGLKEWHIDNTFNDALKQRCNTFNVPFEWMKFYSQQDEDKYVIQHILKDKISDGTFLELGACDGILYSNTKTLEDYFGFNGILVEPIPTFYNSLTKNRPLTEKYNLAISNSGKDTIEFAGINAEGGIVKFLNKNNFNYSYNVKCKKMSDLLQESNFEYIDIMIIDVEGAELDVIKSIDFDFPIYTIFFEAHSDQKKKNSLVGEFLSEHGFLLKDRQRGNEVWYNPNYFRRKLFNL